jgi:hypothetical protein
VTRPAKGGVTIFLPDDAPPSRGMENVLKKILEEDEAGHGLEVLGPAAGEDR